MFLQKGDFVFTTIGAFDSLSSSYFSLGSARALNSELIAEFWGFHWLMDGVWDRLEIGLDHHKRVALLALVRALKISCGQEKKITSHGALDFFLSVSSRDTSLFTFFKALTQWCFVTLHSMTCFWFAVAL